VFAHSAGAGGAITRGWAPRCAAEDVARLRFAAFLADLVLTLLLFLAALVLTFLFFLACFLAPSAIFAFGPFDTALAPVVMLAARIRASRNDQSNARTGMEGLQDVG
jgi:hypothetical protein